MKFLDPNKKPFDISDQAESMGAWMGHEILALEEHVIMTMLLNKYEVSLEDFAAVLCLHYLTAAACAAALLFEAGKEDFSCEAFIENAGVLARFVRTRVEEKRRAKH
jgi:hypothetical protein